MLDHVGIPVSNFERSKEFYTQALRPLGYDLLFELTAEQTGTYQHAGFGAGTRPQFWIGSAKPPVGKPSEGRMHFCFEAKSRDAVRAFYDAAMKAGGTDNGAPGLRPHYHADYYGAFVLDLDGYNIEAVCRGPA